MYDVRPSRPSRPTNTNRWLLWFGLFGGTPAWILHLAIGFALVYDGCQVGQDALRLRLGVLTLILAAVAAAGVWAAYREWKAAKDPHATVLETIYGLRRFMGIGGMLLSGLSLLIILLAAIPLIGLTPCQ